MGAAVLASVDVGYGVWVGILVAVGLGVAAGPQDARKIISAMNENIFEFISLAYEGENMTDWILLSNHVEPREFSIL